jgi:Tfp pilus assembly protein PilO
MTITHSKLFPITLSLLSIVFLAVLILEIYNIQLKNREASELFNLADNNAKMAVLTQSIRMVQTNSAEDIAAFDKLTLSDANLVSLIENIEATGHVLGLNTNIVSVEKIEDKKSAEPDLIRLAIETQGSWAPTLSFLRAIESLPHRVMINESNLSRNEAGPASPRQGGAGDGVSWHLKIILSLYSFN